MRAQTKRGLVAAAVAAATLLPGASALAADAQAVTPDKAVTLDRKLSGRVEPGGGQAYYRFSYPADGSVATINLDVVPDDPAILQSVGFRVYGPDGRLITTGGAQPGLSPDVSADVISTDAALKGDLTVQVFDVDPARAVDFAIWATGVPTAPAAPAATQPPPAATPPAAAPSAAPGAPAAGQSASAGGLRGQLAANGGFAEFAFAYPGDRSVYTVNLRLTPDDPALLQNAGFEVYGPDGRLVAKGGAQPGLAANVSADVIADHPGEYLVKLYNYDPARAADYEVTLATAPPAPESARA